MLKRLEINGFKSFGKKAALDFTSSISGIVGPNGSGKSNVAEAFRFVLGEQSIKSMRGKKGEDLIFNGGKNLPKSNRAGVKVIFDNTKRVLNLDFDEVSLERVVHRDGINQYLINGSQVRLRDIFELLASAHIGSSGHHIISQGEADMILNANLKERRDMIEDALGLKIYHYKKDESEKKLVKTEENIKSVESLRREIAPHIKFLSKQVEKIEKAQALKEKLAELYKDYLAREDLYLKAEALSIKEGRKEPEMRMKELDGKLSDARRILESSEKRDKKTGELLSLEHKLQGLRENKERITRDIGRIEGLLLSLERSLKKEMDKSAQAQTVISVADLETFANSLEADIAAAEKTEDVSVLRRLLTAVRERIKAFVTKSKQSTAQSLIDDINAEVVTAQKEKAAREHDLGTLVKEESRLNAAVASLKTDIDRDKDSNRDAEKAIFTIMAEQNEIRGTLSALQIRQEKVDLETQDLNRELTEASAMIGRAVLEYASHKPEIAADENRKVQAGRRHEIEKIKIRLEEAGVSGSADVMKEFNEANERDQFLAKEIVDLEHSAESLRVLIADLTQKLDIEFKSGVEKINKEFNTYFALMFGGGSASLTVAKEEKRSKKRDDDLPLDDEAIEQAMEDDEDAREGIEIQVSLPHKRIRGLVMLSGGERALTSIALLFAMSQVNPPPFIILDETDAALDEANSRKYGDMVENLSKHSQLIVITHNRETMSRAGTLYGVTMSGDGCSALLSIQFDEAVAVAK